MAPKITIILLVVVCIFAIIVDAGKRKKKSSKVQIVNGEEANSAQSCAKVCSGSTGRGKTDFKAYGANAYVDVDMSPCGFAKIPAVVISVEGTSKHWNALGTSSVYSTTSKSFRVYLDIVKAGTKLTELAPLKWNIEWVAVGFTC